MNLFNKKPKLKTEEEILDEKLEKTVEERFDSEYVICPYCEGQIKKNDIPFTVWSKADTMLIGCPFCKKVLGGYFNN